MAISKTRLLPLFILKMGEKIEGATRFQKLMYLAKMEYNLPHSFEFIKYHYGPFSPELRDTLQFFVDNELINEKSDCYGQDENGYPIVKMTYSLTEKGRITIEANRGIYSKEDLDNVSKLLSWNSKELKKLIAHAYALMDN